MGSEDFKSKLQSANLISGIKLKDFLMSTIVCQYFIIIS